MSRPTRAAIALAGAWCVAITAPRPVLSQRDDGRLARLDATTRVAVAAVIDSARRTRLPTEPLVDKALEGAKKGADGTRIVTAVRGLFLELRMARLALGAEATTDEINAGANALHAGLAMRNLAQLRAAAKQAGRARVTLPLTVASDLVGRSVPVAVASDVVLSLVRSRLSDADFALFQRNVRLDIEHGADAAAAAQTRARGAVLHGSRSS